MRHRSILAGAVVLCLLCSLGLEAQQSDSSVSYNTNLPASSPSAAATVPRLIKFSGAMKDFTGKPLTGPVDINFAIYKEQTDAAPLWQETQTLQLDERGRYTVLLGAMQAEGLPMELFSSDGARWLEVNAAGAEAQARTLLVSVPYALKAGDAETLGGKPASAYLLAQPAQGTTAGTATVIATAPGAVGATPAAAQPGETKSGPTPDFSEAGNANYIPMYSDASLDLGNSVMYQNSGNIGVGTTNPQAPVHVYSSGSTNTTLPGFLFQRPDSNAETHFQHYYPGISYVSQNMYRDVGGLWYLDSAGTPGMAMILSTNTGIEPPNINFLTLPTGGATLPTKVMVIQSSGNVGIGTPSPGATLEVNGTAKFDGLVTFAPSQTFPGGAGTITGVLAGTDLTGGGTSGVVTLNLDTTKVPALAASSNIFTGSITASSFTGNGAGLTGVSASGLAAGTYSNAYTFSNAANSFTAASVTAGSVSASNGVVGTSASSTGQGVYGNNTATTGDAYGVLGTSASSSGTGVFGLDSSGMGVYGTGVFGVWGNGESAGAYGYNAANGSYGELGASANGIAAGVYGSGPSGSGVGVYGTGLTGVAGNSTSGTGYGVYGSAIGNGMGVWGTNNTTTAYGVGVYGSSSSSTGFAGFFEGNVTVTGALTSGVKDFLIDHPLDPANKYLYHSSVESSEMMNIYTGNVVLDAGGEAVVQLPDWFESLNTDFRYQLTAIGAPGPNLYIAQEVQGNSFRVAGGSPGMKVSWQVTGVRQDAYAKAHPLEVEVDKPEGERGYYIHPELYGQPKEKGIDWAHRPQQMRQPESPSKPPEPPGGGVR